MITITEKAIVVVKDALCQAPQPANGLRIAVQVGGCAGLKYLVGLDNGPRERDALIETGGVKVFVDAGSQPHVAGLTVDFVAGSQSSGFIFDNPNTREKCACGKSFS
ncbi:iron-sulfur cluster assembly accessory protein (plasmid) [Sinorhizobium numidicum]|uniref:Iron-sulfur cluster assembly accessory protein n=1 Tax=Sinorhizobium numidicum TaxID=680248 RepID=A0ABY8D3T5_9HYPH|nr:iron-sulfur cluster assembly accessory protein [Sinorhizobium numidicum]WEX79515.1 iron-sulfur cluster assembly accessory protein [Sinorhizobium numidicum]WEX85531.1 iron-sulfur cluster assembly accessory protein [Sinorhizobium numidicum]